MSNNSNELELLFNPGTEVVAPKAKSTEEWKPSADKGINGVYSAVIRFVPWYKNPTTGSIKDKWQCFLKDPITNNGKYVDCPTSIGQKSILQDMFFKLRKSESVALQKQSEVFSRKRTFASLIQILEDKNNPDLKGKILVWKYGVKVWDKLNLELKPLAGEKHDPFDILKGKAFAVQITKVSGFNNYDKSSFVNQIVPLCIPNETTGKLEPIKADADKQKVFEWVKTNSPDLDKYDYREWDNETHEFVNHVINVVTGQATVPANYASVANSSATAAKPVKQDSGITSTELNLDELSGLAAELDSPSFSMDNDISGDLDELLKNA